MTVILYLNYSTLYSLFLLCHQLKQDFKPLLNRIVVNKIKLIDVGPSLMNNLLYYVKNAVFA